MRKTIDDHGGPADVGTMWRMTRDRSVARCALFSLPSEWELRILVDDETLCTTRCSRVRDLFSLAEDWEARLSRRGWTPVNPRHPLRSAVA